MTDIKIPVSAPGAQKTTQELLAAAEATYKLMMQEQGLMAGYTAFNAMLEKEAALLNQKVSPALAKAREEARTYNAIMNQGRISAGQSFLANSSISKGGGGFGGGDGGGGGLGNSRTLMMSAKAVSFFGGELGQAAGGLSRMAALAGHAGLGLGVVAGAAIFAGYKIHEWQEKEAARLDTIEAETKLRQDLNKTLREAAEGQQKAATSSYMDLRSARRMIAARSGDAMTAQMNFAHLEQEGDPAIIKAMAKFLGTKNGQKWGVDQSLERARAISDTGAMSTAEALDALGKSKGMDINKIIARSFGKNGSGSNEFSDSMRGSLDDWTSFTGSDKADELHRKAGQAGLNDSMDMRLILPQMARDLKAAVDPIGDAAAKFRKALEDTLIPLEARTKAEAIALNRFQEMFPNHEELDKLNAERRTQANVMR